MISNGSVWKVDQIPERIAKVQSMIHSATPIGPSTATAVAVLIHCSAGCDRTGEFIGSYRMQYEFPSTPYLNASDIYVADVAECGRAPDYWATSALQWFCFDVEYASGGSELGDCLKFAKCTDLKHCEPINGTALIAPQWS